jgi:guanylate kinase
MLVILSGVAGAGKDTIKKELIKRMDNVVSLPSYTTRPMREGDIVGETYNFVSKQEFEDMIANNEFYEYDIHHNNYYGTSKKLLNEIIGQGKIIVKDIDVNGTQNLIELLGQDTKIITIFLRVPKEELKRRLENRVDKPNPQEVMLRLNRFDYEESKMDIYDYVMKNDNLEKALDIIQTIIEQEYKEEQEAKNKEN